MVKRIITAVAGFGIFLVTLFGGGFPLFADPEIGSSAQAELILYFQGLTLESPEYEQLRVAVPEISYSGNSLSAEDSRLITDLFQTALVNTYSFLVLERESLNAILEEQRFQLSGWTDDRSLVSIAEIVPVSFIFIGELIDSDPRTFLLEVKCWDVEKETFTQTIISEPFSLDTVDTFFEKLARDITIQMGAVIPVKDIDTGRIIAVGDNRKRGIINIGAQNIEPSLGTGVRERFIYVLYRSGKPVNRGLVVEVSDYSSTVLFNRPLPDDVLSNPAYELILYGYLPFKSESFTGPLVFPVSGMSKGHSGYQVEYGIQIMTLYNVAFDLFIGCAYIFNSTEIFIRLPDGSAIIPEESWEELEAAGPVLAGRWLFSPVGISYYFRNLNSFSVGVGLGCAIDIALYNSFEKTDAGILPKPSLATKIVPSLYLRLIPAGRQTVPDKRTSPQSFTLMSRVIPLPDDVVITFGMGAQW